MRAMLANFLAVVGFTALFFVSLFYMVPARAGERICGKASWYSTESGSRTATGERFTGNDLTAAMPSRTHLGEHWRVTYGHRSVVVRVNDLGPAKRLHRIVDLSKAAFARLAQLGQGTVKVCMEQIR